MSTFPPVANILSLAAQADKVKLSSGDVWLMLCDFNWNGQHVRLARNNEDVEFDAGDGAGVQTYQKFNFDLKVERNAGSQLPSVELRVSNVLGLLQAQLEEFGGGAGAAVSMYFLNTAFSNGEDSIAFTTTLMQPTFQADVAIFKLGAPAPQRQLFPRFLYRQDFCMWVSNYNTPAFQAAHDPRGKWCGYVGSLPTCDGTFGGANGCKVHGNEQRFGAFPGIGTNGGAIASQT